MQQFGRMDGLLGSDVSHQVADNAGGLLDALVERFEAELGGGGQIDLALQQTLDAVLPAGGELLQDARVGFEFVQFAFYV